MFALQSWIWIAPNVVVRPTVEAAVLHVRDVIGDKVVAQYYLPLSASLSISIMAAGATILVSLWRLTETSSLSPVTRNSAWLVSARASR